MESTAEKRRSEDHLESEPTTRRKSDVKKKSRAREENGDAAATVKKSCIRDETGDPICDDEWRNRLAELLRQRPRATFALSNASKPADQAALLRSMQNACSSGKQTDWDAVIHLAAGRSSWIPATVRQLSDFDCAALLITCIQRYSTHPKERPACTMWILQILKHRRSLIFCRRELMDALKDLQQHLETESKTDPLTSEALACLGTWRLAGSLVQRSHRHRTAASAATNGAASSTDMIGVGHCDSDSNGD